MSQAQSIQVNKLEIGKCYSLSQIKAELGNDPTKEATDTNELGAVHYLEYGEDVFHFDTGNGFTSFRLTSPRYSVSGINSCIIKVGDNISKLTSIPDTRLVLKKEGCYHLYLKHWDNPIEIGFSDNNITYIGFAMSV